jgi:hypothetical protein
MEEPMTFDQTSDRAVVESRMLDTCVITRDVGGVDDDTIDPETLNLTPAGVTTIYTGPCSISPAGGTVDRREGDRQDTRQEWNHRLPLSAPIPKYGDVVEITAVHADGDPALVGRRFVVQRIGAHTLGVSRLHDEKAVTVQ